jgi:hypothetical protein
MHTPAEAPQAVARTGRRVPVIPEAFWSPLAGAFLMLVPGLLSIAFGQIWLFPSLGPTAFQQVALPQAPTSRFYNVVAGHLIGAVVAIVLVLLIVGENEPSVFELKELTARRLAASVVAVAVTLLVAVPIRVGLHPPAAATTLLVTFGAFPPTWAGLGTIAIGVMIVAVLGEALRRARLVQPGQS